MNDNWKKEFDEQFPHGLYEYAEGWPDDVEATTEIKEFIESLLKKEKKRRKALPAKDFINALFGK